MSIDNYSLLLKQAEALLDGESDAIANAANLSSLLYHNLDDINWLGFYFLRGSELVLGPFMGQAACTRIPISKGVCGTAFAAQKTTIVSDVHIFDGHIACDAASEAELVVPFFMDELSGVLDVDSPIKSRFTDSEKDLFEAVVALYCRSLCS